MVYQGGWKVNREQDNHIQCSLIKNPVVYLEPIARQKIEVLMGEYPHQEWLAYLIGRISEKENFFVEELSVPPHEEVSAASAVSEPFHKPENCIGIIHSHHQMGAFHSITDQTFVDRNFPVSITVAKKAQILEFDAVSYQVTPCGKGTITKCPVKYVQPQLLFDRKVFLEEAKANIDKGRTIYLPPFSGQYTFPPSYRLLSNLSRGHPKYLGSDYVIDDKGNVISQKELDDITRDIWGVD